MEKYMPKQDITIYHKNNNSWVIYHKIASFRNTSYLNHTKNGSNSTENALIRVFDTEGYNLSWFVNKGDIIVNKSIDDTVTNPLTELKTKYGEDNVYKITTIDKFIFDDVDLSELNHIKLGAI